MKVYATYAGRVLADFFPERRTLQYQVVADDTYASFGEAAAASMFGWPEGTTPLVITDVAGDAVFTFGEGYEGIGIAGITIQQFSITDEPLSGVTQLVVTEDVVPTEGSGTGRILEASVRVYTAENREYQLNEFGHDLVDINGTYRTYEFSVPVADNAEEWEEHEDTGHTIVNELLVAKDTKYVIYVNDAATEAITYMTNFIDGSFV